MRSFDPSPASVTGLRRVVDIGAAWQALGHGDFSTTAAIYSHFGLSDLERAMEACPVLRKTKSRPTVSVSIDRP